MPTDRRARLHCATCGTALTDATADRNMLAAWTYGDACLAVTRGGVRSMDSARRAALRQRHEAAPAGEE